MWMLLQHATVYSNFFTSSFSVRQPFIRMCHVATSVYQPHHDTNSLRSTLYLLKHEKNRIQFHFWISWMKFLNSAFDFSQKRNVEFQSMNLTNQPEKYRRILSISFNFSIIHNLWEIWFFSSLDVPKAVQFYRVIFLFIHRTESSKFFFSSTRAVFTEWIVQ